MRRFNWIPSMIPSTVSSMNINYMTIVQSKKAIRQIRDIPFSSLFPFSFLPSVYALSLSPSQETSIEWSSSSAYQSLSSSRVATGSYGSCIPSQHLKGTGVWTMCWLLFYPCEKTHHDQGNFSKYLIWVFLTVSNNQFMIIMAGAGQQAGRHWFLGSS